MSTAPMSAIEQSCECVITLSSGANNPREAPPYLFRASYLRVPPKVKAQADAVEIDRMRAARIILSRRARVLRTAPGRRTKLPGLHVKRTCKAIKPQTSAPELHERQARLREKQSLNLAH